MDISGYGAGRTSEGLLLPWFKDELSITAQRELENMMPQDRRRTGNITSLKLSKPRIAPHFTELILHWPSRLTNLSIFPLSFDRIGEDYTTEVIQRFLDIHRNSLKRVTLGTIGRSGNSEMPDFSSFPHLEELHICAHNMIKFETAPTAARKLSAPNLRCVTADYKFNETRSDQVADYEFRKDQATWMHDFARLKKEQYPSSKLEKVVFLFNPYEYRTYRDLFFPSRATGPVTWPWEYLEQAKQFAAGFGLTVDFTTPMTREEWNAIPRLEMAQETEVLEPATEPTLSKLVDWF
ncbi:hypothetical protein EG329_003939 [Mollisiaceae sp. DMI_Dod_QoI]|nr:hypothetical protein EG329_003939 [Helotiales sp. DMI_Dod_QoI]